MENYDIIQFKNEVINDLLENLQLSLEITKWWEFLRIYRIKRIKYLAVIKLINLDCK